MKFGSMILALLAAVSPLGVRGEPGIRVAVREPWSNVFGGRESVFHVEVKAGESFQGGLGWQLVADGRTLSRGEAAVARGSGDTAIRVSIPGVKPGVILQAQFIVTVLQSGKEAARETKPLWVFPENAFSDCGEWLKAMKIRLFDPDGRTAKLFDEAGIPSKALRSVEELAGLKDGFVVIGEGLSFKEYRGLAAGMLKASAAGVNVLCLAPAEGEITLPSAGKVELPVPVDMAFSREGNLARLDKRLDRAGWAPDGTAVVSWMTLRGERGPVLVDVGQGTGDWAWLQLQYGQHKAKWVICGYGIVAKWAGSPTPRFLLRKLMEDVSNRKLDDQKGGES